MSYVTYLHTCIWQYRFPIYPILPATYNTILCVYCLQNPSLFILPAMHAKYTYPYLTCIIQYIIYWTQRFLTWVLPVRLFLNVVVIEFCYYEISIFKFNGVFRLLMKLNNFGNLIQNRKVALFLLFIIKWNKHIGYLAILLRVPGYKISTSPSSNWGCRVKK